ncbi:MAG TPA: branched-chain amino acid ABC transporter permease [Candidatus Limnocylindrales bacterium]|jgi:branched-chain amino acid transport system permease protein
MTASPGRLRVERWSRQSLIRTALIGLVLVGLFFVPTVFDPNVTQKLTGLWILILIAAMWNALAGYGGLVSVGQQAFIGIGAYATIYLAHAGVDGYLAMAMAVLFTAAFGFVTSFVALRLKGGEFAIAMWVIAEVFRQLVSLDGSVGGGTGISFTGLSGIDPDYRRAFTYWWVLAAVVVAVLVLFFLLRSRHGAALQAIRDDEVAASSLGVRVLSSKRLIFVLTSTGCGAAGAAILANTLFVQPNTIFSVQWTAMMIFMVLVGGLGTFEGPIIGAVILFLLQDQFGNGGVWYLVGLGTTAILFALFLPRGIWGTITDRFEIPLAPIGYWVRGQPSLQAAATADASDETQP